MQSGNSVGPSGETAVFVFVLTTEEGGTRSPSALKPQGPDAHSQELAMASGILGPQVCLPHFCWSLPLLKKGRKAEEAERKKCETNFTSSPPPEKQKALKGVAVPKVPAFVL